jgi:hypothetical protein
MVLGIDSWGHQGSKFGLHLTRAEQVGAELASQLDLVLDRPVLLEIPVEQVPAARPFISESGGGLVAYF